MSNTKLNPADLDDLEWFEDPLSEIDEDIFDMAHAAFGLDYSAIYSELGYHVGRSDDEPMHESHG